MYVTHRAPAGMLGTGAKRPPNRNVIGAVIPEKGANK
jgi:hypothetical protein